MPSAGRLNANLQYQPPTEVKGASGRAVILVAEETNVLNPAHPDAAKIMATKIRKWTDDARLTP
jgi:hypothetical protein